MQYNFKVFYILKVRNFIPNALLQFSAIGNGKKSPIKPLILNNIWFIYIKACINNTTRAKFVKKYIADNKYAKTIKNLKAATSENASFFLKIKATFYINK